MYEMAEEILVIIFVWIYYLRTSIIWKLKEKADTPEDGVLFEKKVFDEEEDLPFADNSLDLVVSSLK